MLGIGILFLVDIFTGREISFSIFYLLPVSGIAWVLGTRAAVATALLSGLCWYIADIRTGNVYSHPAIPVWNAIMRVIIFTTVGAMLSRLKQALSREQEARRIALEATQAKSAFLANMSHEIRNPLNAMIGAADILAETELTAEQEGYLQIFKSEGEQTRRLLNDILDYSKIEAHRLQLEQKIFDLHKLVTTTCQSLEPLCKEKGLELECSSAPDFKEPRRGDPHRLKQVLTNLLNNAVKFTHQGSITLQVNGSRDRAFFRVEDTGVGIPEEQQKNLFGRFNQAEASVTRRFGGSGLGLSIARGLVEAMRGEIHFTSVVNRGTSFWFEIDLPHAQDQPDFAPQPAGPAFSDLKPPVRILRFLLVDDYEFNRRIISHFLRHPAIDLQLATNGREGLDKILQGHFDLVLLDMHMPEMDGWTVAREVRAWEKASSRQPLPMIALTASALKEDEERCLQAGCTSFLGKPIRKADLLNEIARLLQLDLCSTPVHTAASAQPEVDPEITKLVPGFLDEVASRCDALLRSAGRNEMNTARDIAHQLIGLGGSYGFGRISDVARQIESAALHNEAVRLARLTGELKAYVFQLKGTYE